MEFDSKYRSDQDTSSQQPLFLCDNNYPKLEDGLSLQDFQNLDQLHIPAYGSSSNSPDFGTNIDHFDHALTAYASAATTNNDKNANNILNPYQSKPFSEQAALDYPYGTFHAGGGGGGGGGGEGEFFRQPLQAVGIDGIGSGHPSNFPYYNCHGEMVKPVNFVIQDEVSCTSTAVENNNNNDRNGGGGYYKSVGMNNNNNNNNSGRTRAAASALTKRICKGRRKSTVVKGQWTVEEDRVLVQLVEEYGVRKWSFIAQMLKGRIGKQCRERWHNHLRPNIKKDTWSEEEDKVLIRAHEEIGNKWAEIAKRLPGRTENNIKNHWNATKRRQFSRRKCRSKFPRQSSLLQNYIKSLNLNSNSSTTTTTTLTPHLPKNRKVADPSSVANNTASADYAMVPAPSNTMLSTSHQNGADRLVADFDFNDVPDLPFDASIMFEERCGGIDSLFDEENVEMNEMMMMPLDDDHMDSLMQCEVKKELDLVEMISQVNQ